MNLCSVFKATISTNAPAKVVSLPVPPERPFCTHQCGQIFWVLCVPLFPEELAMFLNGSCVTTGLKYQLQQLVTSH